MELPAGEPGTAGNQRVYQCNAMGSLRYSNRGDSRINKEKRQVVLWRIPVRKPVKSCNFLRILFEIERKSIDIANGECYYARR